VATAKTIDLKSDEGLRRACQVASQPENWNEDRRRWIPRLASTLERIRGASEAERASAEFQDFLWENNHIAAAGQGNISVAEAVADPDFRSWLARRSMEPLPTVPGDRIAVLNDLYAELVKRLEPHCSRTPHLKILRVLAALYFGALTTIADRRALRRLYLAMGGPRSPGVIERHAWILDRLEQVLGTPSPEPAVVAARIALPWFLYAENVQPMEAEPTEEALGTAGESRLIPLPAARRRRGLTAIRGSFASVLSILDFVRDGVTRDELLDFLRSEFAGLKESSLGALVNVLVSELAVARRDGDRYVLTERGESVVESQDPSDLADWLLTHVLGVDFAIDYLRKHEPIPAGELAKQIKSVNPSWTSLFVPQAIVSWLRSLGVVKTGPDWTAVLTDVGQEWAARIHWTPEILPRDEPGPIVPPRGVEPPRPAEPMALPSLPAIRERVEAAGRFAPSVIAQLHTGLWAHPRRHFAILTGLSGSGKTLLARAYGAALSPSAHAVVDHVCTVAVQPGWYDPGALLGYVNPLRGDSYVSTPFLEFLLAAADDPTFPYVAILDEMNLSHPEQYLAPLLSAMETGAPIELHTEGDVLDGIPPKVAYPSNLVLIGTVNMDETTHGLSDKVLDRAFTLEFWDIDIGDYPRWGKRSLAGETEAQVRSVLAALIDALKGARLHFGWRVIDDVLDFVTLATAGDSPLSPVDALDGVVYAKVIPKLRGDDSPRFRAALDGCAKALRDNGLARSHAKVDELKRDLETTGSARFWR